MLGNYQLHDFIVFVMLCGVKSYEVITKSCGVCQQRKICNSSVKLYYV